jgi:hypothetical protein
VKFEPAVYTLKSGAKIVGKVILSVNFIKGDVAEKLKESELMKDYMPKSQKYHLKYSLFGLRSIVEQDAKRWPPGSAKKELGLVARIYLSRGAQEPGHEIWVRPYESQNYIFSRAANICKANEIRDIELYDDLYSCWPVLEVDFYEEAGFTIPTKRGKQEAKTEPAPNPIGLRLLYFTTIPIIDVKNPAVKDDIALVRKMMGLEGRVALRQSRMPKKSFGASQRGGSASNIRKSSQKGQLLARISENIQNEIRLTTRSQFTVGGGQRNQIQVVADEGGKLSVRISNTGGNLVSVKKGDEQETMDTESEGDPYFSKIQNVYFEDSATEPFCGIQLAQTNTAIGGQGVNYCGFILNMTAEDKKLEKANRGSEIARLKKDIKVLKENPEYDDELLAALLANIRRLKVDFMTYGKFCDYNN